MSKADTLRSSMRQTAVSEENKEKQHQAYQAILNQEPTNEPSNVRTNVGSKSKAERRRFSFDLRPELHRDLKMQCLLDESNMYEVVEMLIENYLEGRKSQRS